MNVQAIILAAGKSKRFNNNSSKLLATICGKPMIAFSLTELKAMGIKSTVVLGHMASEVEQVAKNADPYATFAIQKEQLGTGNALASSAPFWQSENLLVLNGDMPLVNEEIIGKFVKNHIESDAKVSFVVAHAPNPGRYGRIILENEKYKIVEFKDCTEDQRAIDLINAGIYIFSTDFVKSVINKIKKSSVTGEIYITELISLANDMNLKISTFEASYAKIRGVDMLEQLSDIEEQKRMDIIKKFMANGVKFTMPHTVFLDDDVEIGSGTVISAGVQLFKGTKIGTNCFVGPYVVISSSQISDNAKILSHSVVEESVLGVGASAGPFAHLRKNSVLKENAIIGNFVEVKSSTIGTGSKAKHLAYLGDAILGKNVNIGAGTITCNHDGKRKHKTTIEDGAYVGSNSTLIAPLTVGKNAFIAAGSAINKDVLEDDLAIARQRQENKPGYAAKLRDRSVAEKK